MWKHRAKLLILSQLRKQQFWCEKSDFEELFCRLCSSLGPHGFLTFPPVHLCSACSVLRSCLLKASTSWPSVPPGEENPALLPVWTSFGSASVLTNPRDFVQRNKAEKVCWDASGTEFIPKSHCVYLNSHCSEGRLWKKQMGLVSLPKLWAFEPWKRHKVCRGLIGLVWTDEKNTFGA